MAPAIFTALALLLPLLAQGQALLPPPRGPNAWAVFRGTGAASTACLVCRMDPRPADCAGSEIPRTAAPTQCEAFETARDLLRRGECVKVSLRGFTVGDCMPR
jgi:hypothetical protein